MSPALGRRRQEGHEFEVNLGYTAKTLSQKRDQRRGREGQEVDEEIRETASPTQETIIYLFTYLLIYFIARY